MDPKNGEYFEENEDGKMKMANASLGPSFIGRTPQIVALAFWP
jgi:hypothetical protein